MVQQFFEDYNVFAKYVIVTKFKVSVALWKITRYYNFTQEQNSIIPSLDLNVDSYIIGLRIL